MTYVMKNKVNICFFQSPRNKIVISFGDFTCFAVCYFIA